MELYNNDDVRSFDDKIPIILKELDDIVSNTIDPKRKEIIEITKIISEYVQNKQRKLYGGTALNYAIKNKSPRDVFYIEGEPHDMDIYSPEPLRDIVELCNILHQKGYKNIIGREAIHKETYTIAVNGHPYCDFSYVPRKIYNRVPFLTVDNFIVTHPNFMFIDYMRMFIDPLLSHFRWDKSFKRFYLLQKHYPIRLSKRSIEFGVKIPNNIYTAIKEYHKTKETLIEIGAGVYNKYIDIVRPKLNYIVKIPVPYIEFISGNYVDDVKNIINIIKELKYEPKITEHYPFFQFTGFMTDILVNGVSVCRIYDHGKVCMANIVHEGYKIGTFHLNLMWCLIHAMMERVNENTKEENKYYDMASHLIQMRKYYLKEKEKSIFDKTVFRDFVSECVGETKDAKLENIEEIKKLKKSHKKYAFKYDPEEKKDAKIEEWTFLNSSGNIISNTRNYKINFENDIFHTEPIKKDDVDTSKDISQE